MKRIIEGKTYNTETSTRIAKAPQHEDEMDQFDLLYQTRHGAFFCYYGGETPFGDPFENLKPLSPSEAQAWLERYNFVDEIEKLFGEQPEAGEAESRITVRIPDSLKIRIEALAKSNGQSLNAWIMRCLETCANAQAHGQGR
ncbi:toxin-antitoxin system HicB family antitoxin [Methylobacterium sp. P1-11]|uniref:toxin-antitoxin system HicB family antitoxin n=1 Tax=Methylobacterium sp. P1-11 TaxID=2024616 RepID=UPI0011F0163F|nr:toxin-antitoxin system HicB family antitoxin [Methylobacterium sp. P1-11]